MEPPGTKANPAAILAIDVAVYRPRLGPDEPEMLAAIESHWNEVVYPKIAEHRGRLVKQVGDGAWLRFASVADAMECAVDIQNAMRERNAEVPANHRAGFRLGINLGDLIADPRDRAGYDTFVAGCLQMFSPVGGISVSETVYSHVRNMPALRFADLGTRQFKRFKRVAVSVHAYGVQLGQSGQRP
jgi:adenylate cyclase